MRKPASPLAIRPRQRKALQHILRSRKAQQRLVLRARIVLAAADGKANRSIARELNVSRPTVLQWRRRFESQGVEGLKHDAPRPGRPRRIDARKVEAIVAATLQTKPKAATHWSVRTMAAEQGISPATVQRIWTAHGLQPHRVETFKLSRDKRFIEKLRDVVGLYLNPPEHALILSIDEKSQIQALDRTQPGLPLKKGRAGTMTHDYKRNGTTTLFAALNVLEGTVIGTCYPRHRNIEFRKFLRQIDQAIPPELAVHLILDNYGTHTHPKVKNWLAKNPRWTFHFTPTSASWLNAVEGFFAKLTNRRLKRGVFRSVADLEDAINRFVAETNADPKPFVWTARPNRILAAVKRGKETLESIH